jgi:mannose-1-phosphate guanylyltransferase
MRWHGAPWALILAGGDGLRLRALTRHIAGDLRPKQYCAIEGGQTLLDVTRGRAGLVVPDARQVIVVTRTHEPYYRYLTGEMLPDRLVVQPENRGTGPGILYPLLRISACAGDVPVVVLPSDHHVSDEAVLAAHLREAVDAVIERPETIVLLGIAARAPETDYGWIDPLPTPLPGTGPALFPIRRFWEKPSAAVAHRLMQRGCLWNSFMMVGFVHAFLRLVEETIPELLAEFGRVRTARTAGEQALAADEVYAGLASTNFSDRVLVPGTHRLATLRVKDLAWSDWGHAGRVLATLRGTGSRPSWLSDLALETAG